MSIVDACDLIGLTTSHPQMALGGGDRVQQTPKTPSATNPDGSWQPPTPPGVTVPVEPGGSVTT